MLRVKDGFNKLTADFLKIFFLQGNGTLVWRYETANTKDAAALRPKRGTAGISLPVDTSRIAKKAASSTPTPKPTASPSSRVSGVCRRKYAWQKT
jgi:hypothetical protein